MKIDNILEVVGLPEEKGNFKYIKVMLGKKPALVCGPLHRTYVDILRDYLNSQGLAAERAEIPEPQGSRYAVVGEGFASIGRGKRQLSLPDGPSENFKNGPTLSGFDELIEQTFK